MKEKIVKIVVVGVGKFGEYLDKGFSSQKFDAKKYNEEILKKIDEIL